MKEIIGKVVENRRLSLGYNLLSVDAGKDRISVKPGQFAMIGTEPRNGIILRRPYSIFDHETRSGRSIIRFFFKVVGRGTSKLAASEKGDGLSLLLPLGKGFDLNFVRGQYVLAVIGGMGVAPFYLFFKHLKKFKPKKVLVFLGARNKKELFFGDFLKKKSNRFFVSTDDGSKGFKGFVSDLFGSKLVKDLKKIQRDDMIVFTCGPREMLRKVSKISEDNGIICYVSMEELMGCGIGACLTCVVESKGPKTGYMAACKEGPVFDSRAIKI